MAFADSLLDKLDVWNGKLRLEQIEINDPAQLRSQLRGERGQMLVGAHLGNLEVCRALAEIGEQVTMNVLVHTKHAERFNRLLGEAGATHLRLIQVSELDPATMLLLSQRLDDGEWLAIAGDRIPLHGGRTVRWISSAIRRRSPRPMAAGGLAQMPGQSADVPQAPGSLSPDYRALCRFDRMEAQHPRAGHRCVGRPLRRTPGPVLPASAPTMVQLLPFLEDR